MFKLHRKKTTAGFTLIEVMAAILILSFFLAVTMQAMVIAAMFKVKAKRYTDATAWIQEDLETIRNTGSTLGMNMKLVAPITINPTTPPSYNIFIEEGTGTSLIKDDKIVIGDASKTFTVKEDPTLVPDPLNSGSNVTKITVDSPIGKTFSLAQIQQTVIRVVEVTQCSATASNNGFGQELSENLPTASQLEKTIAGQIYELKRTPSPKNAIPYNILGVTYTVTPKGKPTPVIAENYSEVIPDASLYCPQ